MPWQLIGNLTLKKGKWVSSSLFGGDLIRLTCKFKRPNEVQRALLCQSLPTLPITLFDTRKIYLRQNTVQLLEVKPFANVTLGGLRAISISAYEDGWTVKLEQWN